MKTTSQTIQKLPKFMGAILILIFLTSLKISFFLNVNQYLLAGALFVLFCMSVSSFSYKIIDYKSTLTVTAVTYAIAALLGERGNFNAYIGILLIIIPFLLFLGFKDKYKISFICLLDKVLSISILVSLVAWMIFLVGVPLPHYSMTWNTYYYDNYYLFIYIPNIFYAYPRFQFIFIEPGYFGCLMVFMIFLRKFNFRQWQTIVYLIALILTYSMAGYLMLFLGLAPFAISDKKNRKIYIVIFVILMASFIYLTFGNEDNVIAQMFAYRLQVEEGSLSGYNRNNVDFEYWWYNYFLQHGNFLWGNNDEISRMFKEGEKFGVDLLAYIGRYGIIPLIFYFGSLIYYYKRYKTVLGMWYLLLFFIFYYRGYTVMYYIGFSMLLVAGLAYLHHGVDIFITPTVSKQKDN